MTVFSSQGITRLKSARWSFISKLWENNSPSSPLLLLEEFNSLWLNNWILPFFSGCQRIESSCFKFLTPLLWVTRKNSAFIWLGQADPDNVPSLRSIVPIQHSPILGVKIHHENSPGDYSGHTYKYKRGRESWGSSWNFSCHQT